MRRGFVLGVALALVCAAPASAARIVTLTTTSRFVDPARVQFNPPPPGVAARPNALRVNVFLPDGYKRGKPLPVLYLLHGHAFIEKRFRIRRGRRWHAIAGLSMGGEGAMYLAEQRPGWFGSVASFSGPVSIQRPEYANGGMDTQGQKFTDVFGPPDGFYATAHNPEANTANLASTRVYVTVGNGIGSFDDLTNYFGAVAEADLHQHAEDFVAAARAERRPFTATLPFDRPIPPKPRKRRRR